MKRTVYLCMCLIGVLFSQCDKKQQDNSLSLNKKWKFKIGDDMAWSSETYNDNDWQNIRPVKRWQKQGFPEEISYAWYRISFNLPEKWKKNADDSDLLQIFIGKIDDTDQTFLNGRLIGQNAENIPIEESHKIEGFEGDISAYNYIRNYQLPIDDARIKWGKKNTLAIRVHNHLSGGGMYSRNPHVTVVSAEQKTEKVAGKEPPGKNTLDIGGFWKFKPGDNERRKQPDFDHSGWDSITVGASWSWYGYNFDGYAWYRKNVYLPSPLKDNSKFNEHIKLTIGSIQDYGEIFINGETIKNYRTTTTQNEDYPMHWGFPLLYEFSIDNQLFKWDTINTIAVRVFNSNKQQIGAALAGALLTSLGVSVGVVLPLIFKGSGLFVDAPEIFSDQGITIITGLLIILVGVVFISRAGFLREKQLSSNKTTENQGSGTFLVGLLMAVIAGILSSCISLTFVYSQGPIIEAFKTQGCADMTANIGVWALALMGGVFVNLVYPAVLMTKNKSWHVLFKIRKETILAAIIGIQLITGAVILGRGMVLLGALGASVGFGIQQAMQIAGNQTVGFSGGEWKNIYGRPRNLMYIGLGIVLVSIGVLAFASGY